MKREVAVFWQSLSNQICKPDSLLRMGSIAAFDQLILSGTNFLITIALIKSVPKQEFGYYSIAFAVMLFVISLQNALVTTPLTVLIPGKKEDQKHRYVWNLCWGQYIGLIPVVILVTAASFVSLNFGVEQAKVEISIALALATFGVVLREFYRTYQFAEQQPVKVLVADIFYAALLLSLVMMSWWLNIISAMLVFVYIGLCSASICLLNRSEFDARFDFKETRDCFAENWIYGKWSLLGVTVTHIQKYSYLYFVGGIMGSLAVADVSAARLLMMPFVFLETGWIKVCVPHGARLRENGEIIRYYKELLFASFAMVMVVFAYVTILFAGEDLVTSLFLKNEYSNAFEYVIYWGAIFIVGLIRMNATSGLKVIMRFDSIAKLNIISMTLTVSLLPVLINPYGLKGALASKLVGDLLLCTLLWHRLSSYVLSKKHA